MYHLHRFSTDVGHYTAMIWSNTNKVGCGVTEYVDGKWFAKLYTCNYGPAGRLFFTNNANHFEQSKNEAPMFPISYLSKLAGNGAFGSYCEASGGRLVSLAYTPAAICARPQRRIVKTKIEKNFPKIIFVAEQNMKPKIEEKEMSIKKKIVKIFDSRKKNF